MPMKNSKMPDDWIARNIQRVPFTRLANGNIASCPVRLNFTALFTAKEGTGDDGAKKSSFGAAILLPPGADRFITELLWPVWCEEARKAFPNHWRPDGQPSGLHWPVHLCDDKQQYAGYTPGCYYFNASSQYKPQVTDTALNPIVDPNRVYDGVWAIVALNTYSYKNKKTGVSFGLQNVMIIGDDERLTGGGTDPKQDFGHVQIDAHYDPALAFGGAPAHHAAPPPPPMGIMPPATPVMPGAPAMPPMQPAYPGAAPAYAAPPPPALDYDPLG